MIIQQAQAQINKPKKESKHWLEYAIFAFVVITAGATIFSAWYTRQQWQTAVDTEHRQLRAYVAVVPGPIEGFSKGAHFRITLIAKNYGQTPATDFRVASSEVVASRVDGQNDFTVSNPKQITQCSTIFPGIPDAPTQTARLDDASVEAIERGDEKLVVFGSAEYRDVFDNIGFTDFCYMYTKNDMASGETELCQGNNYAGTEDERRKTPECPRHTAPASSRQR